jgi:hypothetical protein
LSYEYWTVVLPHQPIDTKYPYAIRPCHQFMFNLFRPSLEMKRDNQCKICGFLKSEHTLRLSARDIVIHLPSLMVRSVSMTFQPRKIQANTLGQVIDHVQSVLNKMNIDNKFVLSAIDPLCQDEKVLNAWNWTLATPKIIPIVKNYKPGYLCDFRFETGGRFWISEVVPAFIKDIWVIVTDEKNTDCDKCCVM